MYFCAPGLELFMNLNLVEAVLQQRANCGSFYRTVLRMGRLKQGEAVTLDDGRCHRVKFFERTG